MGGAAGRERRVLINLAAFIDDAIDGSLDVYRPRSLDESAVSYVVD